MLLGVVADDLTGASDIAGFVAASGFSVVQYAGVPSEAAPADCDCAVVSLKSRSVPAREAVRQSLAALGWLRGQGAPRIYFKYCSTFDSTPAGNIGPVTDALTDALGAGVAPLCPSLPVNGRTVRDGVLYVNGTPLAESPMRHHPLNPMTDSFLPNLMDAQSRGKTGVVDIAAVRRGAAAVRARADALERDGFRYAVLDAETDGDLTILAEAFQNAPLLTGGSGLGGAVAAALVAENPAAFAGRALPVPPPGKTIVLSGSCSKMTNAQTARYRAIAPEFRVEVARCLADADAYAAEAAQWASANAAAAHPPLINATVNPDGLKAVQEKFGGAVAAEAVETFFSKLAVLLRRDGFANFIVAGGETSGSVSLALNVSAFRIGRRIAPGVSWVEAAGGGLWLAMKSGNFGDEDFFAKAHAMQTA